MSTVNISLPVKQVSLIDKLVNLYGFANRSEFFRSLLRFIAHKPDLLQQTAVFPFIVPQEKSTKKIIAGFKQSKKYSPEFLKDLEKGLKNSSYFKS